MHVEVDWGAGFVKHHAAAVTWLGASYRVGLYMPARSADGAHPIIRARLGGREALQVRIERIERSPLGAFVTFVALMPMERSARAEPRVGPLEAMASFAPRKRRHIAYH